MTRRASGVIVGAIGLVSSLLSIAVASCASYLSVLTVAAVATSRKRSGDDTVNDELHSVRFAFFVPAHNEAAVIERSVRELVAVDYPSNRFSVHVVADNCTDKTAELARAAGATVHERNDLANPGKGPALNWLFERVDSEWQFDAVAIVDADTVVDRRFLQEMDAAVRGGATVAQGRYDVLEPEGSTAAGIRAAALASRHHVRPLGRNALGGSSGLFGNGMVFARHVLAERAWSGHLVEDAELQNELLLDGVCVDYVPEAIVSAEMPDTLEASVTQNERWELGRLQVARRFVPLHLRSAASGEPALRAARLDAVADHVVPPMSVFAAATGAAGAGSLLALVLQRSRRNRWSFVLSIASAVALVVHVLVSLRLAGAPRAAYRSLVALPKAIAWKVWLWIRVLINGDQVSWIRTERNDEHAR